MIAGVLLSLFLLQASQSQEVTLNNVVEDNPLEELLQPILTKLRKDLNETLAIEKYLAPKRIPDKQIYKIQTEGVVTALFVDQCRNLSDYLPIAQETIEKAFYLTTDMSGAFSGLIVDFIGCLNIDIFKTISCLLRDIGEMREIFNKFKPQLVPMLHEIGTVIITTISLFKECLGEL